MSIAPRSVLALVSALVCALTVLAASGSALAASQGSTEGLLAQERYLSSFAASPPSSGPSPEERYYSSYGTPETLTAPALPAPAEELPWPLILLAGGTAVIAVIGVTGRRPLRVLRRWADPQHTNLAG